MRKTGAYNTIEGVVLAGGLNSRFKGENKAKLVINTRPIIADTLLLLGRIFKRVLIVSNEPEELLDYREYPIVKDIFQKVGPLGGIHSALSNSDAEAVFVVACDMPLLDEKLMRGMLKHYMASDCEVLIPQRDGYNEPLHAIYSLKVLERLEKFLRTSKTFAIKDFLSLTSYEWFPVTQKSVFTNINTPDDLEQIRRDIKRPDELNYGR
ncbi:MAG: molybdenum cofactor guanylyltransferase [Bacteroidales bacterium]|nr:molybdenum cofactor guanylyltransferase [Bacteroidales bacterium]